MKPFLIGDVHLGRKFRNKDIPLDKRGFREQLLRFRFQKYIDLAIESVESREYSCVIQLGDLFDSFAVPYEDLLFAYEQLSRFNQSNVTCYIIAGNHDLSKDKSRISALSMLKKMLGDRCVHIVTEDYQVIHDNLNNEQHVLVPYHHESDSRKDLKIFRVIGDQFKSYIYGHFDEPFPAEWQQQFTHVYTGHIHKPRKEGNITVVGSILPLTFAEDANNSFMRTVTLDEYEKDLAAGVSDYRCYRIKLRDGEELPAEKHCLQMSVYNEKKPDDSEQDINVEFETFDMDQLLHEALDDTGLFEEIYGLYNEYKMAEVSE